MKKRSLAQCLRDRLIKDGKDYVWAGHPDACIGAYLDFGGKVEHPLNKIKATLDAARRSNLFVADNYIRACDSSGRREILHPVFKLAQAPAGATQDEMSTATDTIPTHQLIV